MKIGHLFSGIVVVAILNCFPLSLVHANGRPGPRVRKLTAKRSLSPRVSKIVNNVLFGFNKMAVSAASYPELDRVVKLMADSSASLKLAGYADNKGGYVYNWKLSQKRAEAVKRYLVSRGADSSKIAATEFGYTHPIASNKTAAGRQKNRRVEVHFVN